MTTADSIVLGLDTGEIVLLETLRERRARVRRERTARDRERVAEDARRAAGAHVRAFGVSVVAAGMFGERGLAAERLATALCKQQTNRVRLMMHLGRFAILLQRLTGTRHLYGRRPVWILL